MSEIAVANVAKKQLGIKYTWVVLIQKLDLIA